MPKEPEEFGNSEDRFKLTLLQMEKRFVDLEMSLGELGQKVKDVDIKSVSELKQKVDDIEDMISVEQVGIIELKKMLEGMNEKAEQVSVVNSMVTKSNERLNGIEKEMAAMKGSIVPRNEMSDTVRKLENSVTEISVKSPPTSVEMENFHKRFNDLSSQLKSLSARTENNVKILFEKVKEAQAKEPMMQTGVDFDLLSSKIESLKISLDSMLKKKIEMDLKIVEMEKMFEIIETKIRESVSEKIMDEIKFNKKDLMTANIRVDSLERVIRELITNLQNMENSMKKFENIEKMTSLGSDIEEKIERFKFVEEEMKRLSTRTEMIYDSIDKKLEKIRSVEKRTEEMNEVLERVRKDVDANKLLTLDRVKKEDLKNLYKMMDDLRKKTKFDDLKKFLSAMETRISLMEENSRKEIQDLISSAHSQVEDLGSTPNVVDSQITELLNKIIFIETRIGAVEKLMEEPSKINPVILE